MADHLAGRLPGLIGPEKIWSFAWVEEVAAAHVDALTRGNAGDIIEAGGHNLPQRAPFDWMASTRGTRLPRTLPYWAATLAGHLELTRARLTGAMPLLTPATVEIFKYDWPLTGNVSDSFANQMTRLLAR